MTSGANTTERRRLVVGEYLKRMCKLSETKRGTSTDYYIDCPVCGGHRSLELKPPFGRPTIWKCLNIGCGYVLPEEISPPGPDELEEVFRMARNLKYLKEFMPAE